MYNCFFNADSFIVFSTQRRGGAETQHLLEKTETLQLTFGGAQRRKRHGLCFAEFAEAYGLDIYLYSSLNENLCGLCLSQKLAKPFDWLLRPHATASKDMLCVLFIFRALCASASLR